MEPTHNQFPPSGKFNESGSVKVTRKNDIPEDRPDARVNYVLNKKYKEKLNAFGFSEAQQNMSDTNNKIWARKDKAFQRAQGEIKTIKIDSGKK